MPSTKTAFTQEMDFPDAQINLARAALLLSEYINHVPNLVAPYLARLDDIAEQVRPALELAHTDEEKVAALTGYLFGELDFHGNSENYYDPNNSFLNRVLDRRTGIPISLSVICLEVGWRLGLPVSGLGLPGHFIVGYGLPEAPLYLDPFNRGAILSEDDCLALSRVPTSQRLAFREQFLAPAAQKAVLFRMLLNLKQIYLRQESWDRAYRTLDLMLLVQPNQIEELKDRGLVAYRLNRLREATFDLHRYLYLKPNAPDAKWLRQQLEMIEQKLSRLN
ncbi:MAG: tetratricopeptide repeat protein [Anaerolineales bacterium]|nr:tetratricopeptide repeat protein [Anaerolineales bacterium]